MNAKKLNKILAKAMYSMVIVAMVFSTTGSVYAQEPNPRLTVSITDDWFRAEEFPPNFELAIYIFTSKDDTDPLWQDSRTTDSNGFAFWAFWQTGTNIDLKPGMYLVVGNETATKDIVLEEVTLDIFDPGLDYLAGTAPPSADGRSVWVGTGDDISGCGMDVIADPINGAWEADFSTQPCDVTEGMWGAAQVFDADGDATEANPIPPPPAPFVRAHPVWDNVDAWFWPEDATLHLSIDDPDTEEAPDLEMDMPGTVDPNVGSVWFDFAGIFDLKPGDIVIMTDGSTTHSLTVSTLSIDEVDLEADTISGTVEPETLVRLPFLDNELFVASDSEGNWDANFAQIGFDLTPGTMFIAEVFDEDGDNSSFELYIPNPHFTVFPEWEWFDGLDWPDGATVSINVEGKPECSLARESWDGFFNGNFPEGCNIEAGDTVVFDDGTTNRWHEIRNLYVIDVDTGENTVTGKADEGETVYVWPHDSWFEPLETIVGGSGIWQVDLDDADYTVRDDSEGRSEIRDEMGNATASDWHVTHPHFTVFPEWEWFDGLDWPNGAIVNITVAGKDECETAKESWGYFFNGSFGEGCDLDIGDTVTFTDGETTQTHTVQNLMILKVTHYDDTVMGMANPGAEVYVWPHATGEQKLAIAKTKGAAMGKWHVDFTETYDLTPGDCGRSEIRDENANSTAVDWCIPNPRIVASESGDWFWTTDFKPGDLDISIYDSADEGATLLWSGQQVTDESSFAFVGYDVHGLDLIPGYYLVISDGDAQKSIELLPISVTMFDTQYEFMAGFAAPGSEVWAAAGPQDWQERIMINPDPDTGEWYADFAEIGFDITEDMQYWSYAHIYDEDGDANEGNVPYLTNWVAAYTYDLPEDSFADNGVYPYHFELEWNFPRADTWEGQGGEFVISDLAPISNGYVLLRGFRELRGSGTPEGPVCDEAGDIHPDQQMRFLFGWATDYPMTYEEALAHFDSLTVRAVWSEEMSAELTRHDIMDIDSMDWPQYVCDFTEAPPPHIVASITEDWFYLLDFAPYTSFDYSVYENYGGTQLWQGSETTDGFGFAWINADGRWDFEPGNYLFVSDGTSTKELVIEGFTFDIFNAANGQLSGTVPEQYGRNLWVGVGWEGGGWSMDITTDENGAWFSDFGQPVPSDYGWVYAQLFDDDGDATELRPASQIIFLRPACGDTYTVQPGSLLEIRYGSWVAIGEGLANQNAAHLTVELVLNGVIVAGEKQPVVPRSEIPCGIPVEDAYGVYYAADIGPLDPGEYTVSVTWSFDIAVTDGYDADGDGEPDWYGPGEIFTREFTLTVP